MYAIVLGDNINNSCIVTEIHFRDQDIVFIAIAIMIKHRLESDTCSDSLHILHARNIARIYYTTCNVS